jgi:protein arginine kinase activator
MKVCTQCGWSSEELQQQTLLGCSHCFEVFQKELEEICLSIHGTHFHTKQGFENVRKIDLIDKREQAGILEQMAQLQEALSDAVREEQFEKAQAIKKQIQALKTVQGK